MSGRGRRSGAAAGTARARTSAVRRRALRAEKARRMLIGAAIGAVVGALLAAAAFGLFGLG